MDSLLDNGYYITAGVLRLEVAQRSTLYPSLDIDQLVISDPPQNDEFMTMAELAKENLNLIANLISSSNSIPEDPIKRFLFNSYL